MAKIAKRLKEIRAAVDKTKQYDVVEGFKLLKDTAKVIDNKSNLWVKEISDGKYELNIEHNNIHKSVEIKAWDSKEEFADAVYMLFVMPEQWI